MKRALRPPQCPERRNFEGLAGESEGDGASWADREKISGNPCGQFVECEDTGCHGCEVGRRIVAIQVAW